jgi:guanylate kinase
MKYGLLILSAPSGAGKSTLCTRLLARLSDRIRLSVSSTSRAPRGAEVSGREYFFLTADEFKASIQKNFFAEWALVHDHYYGTAKSTIEGAWNQNKHVLLDIDVQGAKTLADLYGKQAYRIFISPPSIVELEARLRSRGTDSEEVIQKRIRNAQAEMDRQDEFDSIIVNDILEEAYEELENQVLKVLKDWEGQ